MLAPIYEHLGHRKATARPGFHAITGCDSCGQVKGKGKKTSFKVFLDCLPIRALENLGTEPTPADDVINGCEAFLCKLFSPTGCSGQSAADLRWKSFKSGVSVEKIPQTSAALKEHILRAHLQARLWCQDTTVHPQVPDPLKNGWTIDTS